VFVCSLIFVQELAEKLVEIVQPRRDGLDACLCFPSMPEVMKLNKLGTFDLTTITGGPLGGFAQQVKALRQKSLEKGKPSPSGGAFQDSLLKLVRTLPKVLKFLPGDQAKDARTFIVSLQHWLGGTTENLEAMLLRVSAGYVEGVRPGFIDEEKLMDPVVLPDQGIWHPLAPEIFQSMGEYKEWYNGVHLPLTDIPSDAPLVGVILQKSHIATQDDGHYVAMVPMPDRIDARPELGQAAQEGEQGQEGGDQSLPVPSRQGQRRHCGVLGCIRKYILGSERAERKGLHHRWTPRRRRGPAEVHSGGPAAGVLDV
jgi:magnesium chelatase subunit H